jgi:hypothetical protein
MYLFNCSGGVRYVGSEILKCSIQKANLRDTDHAYVNYRRFNNIRFYYITKWWLQRKPLDKKIILKLNLKSRTNWKHRMRDKRGAGTSCHFLFPPLLETWMVWTCAGNKILYIFLPVQFCKRGTYMIGDGKSTIRRPKIKRSNIRLGYSYHF